MHMLGQIMMLLMLLLLSLLAVTTGTSNNLNPIYIVTPYDDDHRYHNTTCPHCHTLQHYMLNVTKYFASNTQLLFLPGEHHLYTDLIIQDVHNISLIGSNSIPIVKIKLIQSNEIKVINSSIVTIKSLIISETISFLHILNILLHNIFAFTIIGDNIMGESVLSNITISNYLIITHDDDASVSSTSVHKLTIYNSTIKTSCIIEMKQTYGMSIVITDSIFSPREDGRFTVSITSNCVTHLVIKEITFNNVHFLNNYIMDYMFRIEFTLHNAHCFNKTVSTHDKVFIKSCRFTNNKVFGLVFGKWFNEVASGKIQQMIIIEKCVFANNKLNGDIMSFGSYYTDINNAVYISDIKFLLNDCKSNDLISITNIKMQLKGSIIFHENIFRSLFSLKTGSSILLHDYFELLQNKGNYMIYASQVFLMKRVTFNITKNAISVLFFSKGSDMGKNSSQKIPLCYFQFYGNKILTNKVFEVAIRNSNSSLIFNRNAQNINCRMLPGSTFYKQNPLYVYQQYIHFRNDLGNFYFPFNTGILCYCLKEQSQNCFINTLGPIFPGQLLTIELCINPRITSTLKNILISINMHYAFLPKSHCKVPWSKKNFEWITRNCTKFYYTILSNNEEQCELVFSVQNYEYTNSTIFYVKMLRCPMGFSFNTSTERCECDLSLQSKFLAITKCNINDQTVLRPANSWISASANDNFYTYRISPNCPLRYCLPQSSSLNFSTPNSQCQFNRSGILCGKCQQNLSTVFGSSKCHPCSNLYLLLIIPITIAGLLLVLTLFFINLTVTDGTINAFIMYTNIISVNDHVFITDTKHVFSPVHTFISLANLDLGIQTCFYNRMDDYAKMWLQLAFPFYLISIATLLIITSRYSTTVQRLTTRRALPVLATLFLLSYTKILRTVSSVLFSYSKITHLPSEHTTIVWSVDANVPPFGIKFIILFIVCLILFIALIPFNMILLFTRTLSRFQFINKFKPLLDAYQVPYKHRFYYWAGLQLLMRAIFFGITALDKNANLIISSIILSIMIMFHGIVHPFNSSIKNYQEILYFTNLQILYGLTLSAYHSTTTVNVMITLAAAQFIIIIIYHTITYSFSGVIRIKIDHFITSWINKSNRPSNSNSQVHNIEIPEITYNYREYREPLIGLD